MGDSEELYTRALALLATGQHLDLDRPEAIDALKSFETWEDMDRAGRQDCQLVAERLTLSQQLLLIQMLTVLEREFRWRTGSVSSIIWFFRDLRKREPIVADLLGDWIAPRTNNDYLPIGNHDSLQQWITSRRPRVNLHAAHDEAARTAAIPRQEARILAELERERKAEALARKSEEAKAAYLAGTRATGQTGELLRYVAFDVKHKVEFFPKAWARVSRDELLQLDSGARAALAERLQKTNSVTWRRLCKRLAELESA